MKTLMDPTFKYVPSNQTNLRRTFARVRREMAQAKADAAKPAEVVTVLRARKAKA